MRANVSQLESSTRREVKVKVTGFVVVGLGIVAMAGIAEAQIVDSFHGLKFGVPLSEQMQSCNVSHAAPCWDKVDEDGVEFYKVQLTAEDQELFTKMDVGEVNGGVGDVSLMFNLKNFQAIKDAMTNKFGQPSFVSDTDELWDRPGARVYLFTEDDHHQGVASATSDAFRQHQKEQKAAKAAKAQRAF